MTASDGDVQAGSAFFVTAVVNLHALQLLHDTEVSMVDGVVEAVEALGVFVIN